MSSALSLARAARAAKAAAPVAASQAPRTPRTPRVKKEERGYAPEGSGLRPSEYRLARRLIWMFGKLRNDTDYGRRFDELLLREKEKAVKDARSLAEWRAQQTEPAPLRVRASELKDCARKQAFRIMGFTPAPTPTKYGNWNIAAMSGSDLHLLMQTALKFLGIIKREVEIAGRTRYGAEFNVKTPANDFSGRVDALVDGAWFTAENDWSEGDEEPLDAFLTEAGHLPDAVLDIKTVGPDDFAEGAWGRKVQGYIAQVSAYARLLGVSRGIILLVDRGSGKMHDFAWDIDPIFAESQFVRATAIVEHVKRGELPEAENYDASTGKFDGTCFLFCPFRDYCRAEVERGEVSRRLVVGQSPQDISLELKWVAGRG